MDNTQNHEQFSEISLQSITYDHPENGSALPNAAIQEEILWGEKYRALKASQVKPSILPKKSPINVPFKVCRERQRQDRESSRHLQLTKTASGITSLLETDQNFKVSNTPLKNKPVPSLLERSTLNQRQYMELLSIPNSKPKKQRKIKKGKKVCCKCLVEPCPPRIVELSVPQKRHVISNWQRYAYTLSVERIEHLNNLLHTNKNLDPRDARYYFKQLDKLKRKEKRRKKLAKLRKLKKKERGNALWAKKEINFLSKAIVKYIKEEPLFALNFRQMLLSDNLLQSLENKQFLKKPNRSTKSAFKKTAIEISDKTTIWIDSLLKFVDMQAVESEAEIKIPSLYSMEFEGEEEEEGESEEESSEGEDRGEAARDFFGLEEGEDLFEGFEGFGEDLDFLNDLDQDLLEKLIRILGHCSEEFLLQEVNPDKMPGVTYADILERLKMLREGLRPEEESKPFLEQVMIDWAIRNEPENVDQPILDKIHETALLLSDWLLSQGDYFRSPGFNEDKQGGLDDIIEEPTTTDEYGGATDTTEGRDEYFDPFEGGEDGLNEDFDSKYVEDMMDEEARREGDEASPQAEEDEAGLQEGKGEEGLQNGKEDEVLQNGKDDEGLQNGKEDEVLQKAEEDEALLYQGGEDGDLYQTDDEGRKTDEEARRQTEGDLAGQGGEEDLDMGGQDVEGGMGVGDGTDLYIEGEEGAGWTENLDEFGRPIGEGDLTGARQDDEEAAIKIAGEKEDVTRVTENADEKKLITEKSVKGEGEEFDLLTGVIKGHKPSVTFEHAPDTVCCLSLKIWAVWLLEITHNAHNWTQWLSNVIQKVREFAAIVRGDIVLPNGEKKVLYKEEWRKFAKETEEMAVTWRQYSKHVRDLTEKIVENFHKKTVNCCPKCLEDHLIKNVVTAHETLRALTEAMNCAGYWQRCLDEILTETMRLTNINIKEDEEVDQAEGSEFSGINIREIEEIYPPCAVRFEMSEESIYEIEELQ